MACLPRSVRTSASTSRSANSLTITSVSMKRNVVQRALPPVFPDFAPVTPPTNAENSSIIAIEQRLTSSRVTTRVSSVMKFAPLLKFSETQILDGRDSVGKTFDDVAGKAEKALKKQRGTEGMMDVVTGKAERPKIWGQPSRSK